MKFQQAREAKKASPSAHKCSINGGCGWLQVALNNVRMCKVDLLSEDMIKLGSSISLLCWIRHRFLCLQVLCFMF